ncbi:MAG: IS1595 family transposase [Methylovirgula sp.]
MANSVLNAPHFQNEEAAFAYVEAKLWPHGPTCPHCGNADSARIGKLSGKTTRLGLRKCYECKKPFTVRQNSIFESSHLPLHLWLQVIHLMCASKKGISTRQIQRMLSCSMKTAWFLTHRIREAMRGGTLPPMGGDGGIVEVDETYIGRLQGVPKPRGGSSHKNVVLTLVERGGAARSFHVESVSIADMMPIVHANVAKETAMMTDQGASYPVICEPFASHDVVNHAREEYVRREGDKLISTNTVEGYYSIFKRGMIGTYQHCSEKHLHRYLAEFDFRYSYRIKLGIDDVARADLAIKGAKGKRLTYQTVA